MPRTVGPLSLALLMPVLFVTSALGADYIVRVGNDNPFVAQAILRLPPSNGELRKLTLRGVGWGLQSQVSEVRGEISLLASPSDGQWIAPADCKTVSWKIHFRDSVAGPVNASVQENVYFRNGRWWLISEPTALLRLQGTLNESSLTLKPESMFQIGATPRENNRWRIPAPNEAPEFFVVGHAKPLEIVVDGFRIIYVADNSQRVAKLGLRTGHVAAFRYLLKLFPQSVDVPKSERRLLVVWIGIDAVNHHFGGAAGSRSFVANYLCGQLNGSDDHAASSLMVVAHEQFHQLTDLCIHRDLSMPIWINESLAQYFGLKALSSSGLPPHAVSRIRQRFIDPDRVVETGLAELSRKFKHGDRSVYPLFYSQGATFWAEVDRDVSAETGGDKSLDDFLPILLRSEFDDSGVLPKTFLDDLREAIGVRMDNLLQEYVGS
jgi:hypothetical protein